MNRQIRLVTEAYPDEPGLDTALSRAMLIRASNGALPETFRLHVPGRIVAFGKRDVLEPGYRRAIALTRRDGYLPVERLAGGRAAAFHEGTLAFSWTMPAADPRPGIRARFAALAELMVRAFRRLGAEAEIGEIPGEYCPGEWSVNVEGRIKVMGVGQRLARHGAHVGGVVVVAGSDRVNAILGPVYDALGLEFRPGATGALEDVIPGVGVDEAAAAIVDEVGATATVVEAPIDPATRTLARRLLPEHVPG